jgi:D-alanine transaminase
MSRVAYVNGRYVPHREACVHIEDRGYQFADGVYEVVAVQAGRMVDEGWHLDRLERSLSELSMDMPMGRRALSHVLRETIRRNRVRNGIAYLQVTRGVSRRDHGFPGGHVRPALVITARRMAPTAKTSVEQGVRVVSVPDIRWGRCDIKTVGLLPNVLAKQAARSAGAYEAWQVDENGYVTEGSSTNAWIVDGDGTFITRPAENAILNGITRQRLIELARAACFKVEERPFTLDEAKQAREAFLTSTTSYVLPIVEIDDTVIGNGRPGSRSLELRQLYETFMQSAA